MPLDSQYRICCYSHANQEAVGDFNGDGKPDILWRNTGSGELYLWYMDGTSRTSGASIATVELNWIVEAVGDLNGDGKADILWRDHSTGQNILWYMNGATLMSRVDLTTVVEPEWRIVGTVIEQ